MHTLEEVMQQVKLLGGSGPVVIEFKDYIMLADGSFGNNTGFSIPVSQECLSSFAAVCHIPAGYLKKIPPELVARNINYGLSKYNVREKYNLLASGDSIVGIVKKNINVINQGNLLKDLDAVYRKRFLVDTLFREFCVSRDKSWFCVEINNVLGLFHGDGDLRAGFCLSLVCSEGLISFSQAAFSRDSFFVSGNPVSLIPPGFVTQLDISLSSLTISFPTIIEMLRRSREDRVADPYQFSKSLLQSGIVGKRLGNAITEAVVKRGNLFTVLDFAEFVCKMGNTSKKPTDVLGYANIAWTILDRGQHLNKRLL